MFIVGLKPSFGLVATFRSSRLRAGRNLVVWRSVWMLAVRLEILVIVVVAIWVIVSMLLLSELMHLLRTRSELVWAAIPSHGHYRKGSVK